MLQDVCGVPDVDGGKLLRAFPAVLDVGVKFARCPLTERAMCCSLPMGPCTQTVYTLWPESSSYVGTLGPKYILFGHMGT